MQLLNFSKVEALAAVRGIELTDLAMGLGCKSKGHFYVMRNRAKLQDGQKIVNVRNRSAKRIADYFGVKVSDISV